MKRPLLLLASALPPPSRAARSLTRTPIRPPRWPPSRGVARERGAPPTVNGAARVAVVWQAGGGGIVQRLRGRLTGAAGLPVVVLDRPRQSSARVGHDRRLVVLRRGRHRHGPGQRPQRADDPRRTDDRRVEPPSRTGIGRRVPRQERKREARSRRHRRQRVRRSDPGHERHGARRVPPGDDPGRLRRPARRHLLAGGTTSTRRATSRSSYSPSPGSICTVIPGRGTAPADVLRAQWKSISFYRSRSAVASTDPSVNMMMCQSPDGESENAQRQREQTTCPAAWRSYRDYPAVCDPNLGRCAPATGRPTSTVPPAKPCRKRASAKGSYDELQR